MLGRDPASTKASREEGREVVVLGKENRSEGRPPTEEGDYVKTTFLTSNKKKRCSVPGRIDNTSTLSEGDSIPTTRGESPRVEKSYNARKGKELSRNGSVHKEKKVRPDQVSKGKRSSKKKGSLGAVRGDGLDQSRTQARGRTLTVPSRRSRSEGEKGTQTLREKERLTQRLRKETERGSLIAAH